jgi:RHS repeat-associated protein
VLTYEEYYPYGATSYQSVISASEVSAKRYRFTAMERDDETGLSHHGARYYAPWLGRWTACDPMGLSDGINPYCFVSDSPIRFKDSTGFWKSDAQQEHESRRALSSKVDDAALAQMGAWIERAERVAAITTPGGVMGRNVGKNVGAVVTGKKSIGDFVSELLVSNIPAVGTFNNFVEGKTHLGRDVDKAASTGDPGSYVDAALTYAETSLTLVTDVVTLGASPDAPRAATPSAASSAGRLHSSAGISPALVTFVEHVSETITAAKKESAVPKPAASPLPSPSERSKQQSYENYNNAVTILQGSRNVGLKPLQQFLQSNYGKMILGNVQEINLGSLYRQNPQMGKEVIGQPPGVSIADFRNTKGVGKPFAELFANSVSGWKSHLKRSYASVSDFIVYPSVPKKWTSREPPKR